MFNESITFDLQHVANSFLTAEITDVSPSRPNLIVYEEGGTRLISQAAFANSFLIEIQFPFHTFWKKSKHFIETENRYLKIIMFSAYSQIFGPEFVRIKIDAQDSITPVSKYTQNTIRNYLGNRPGFSVSLNST